jgi:simple sugar transport system ATP-binding protein
MSTPAPSLEARGVSKSFGHVEALGEASLAAEAGTVTCLLGDNGAGKSTLIQILSGVYQPDSGELSVDGEPVSFRSPRDAMAAGVSTAFQDLAMIPLMPIVRNFFLGREPQRRFGPLKFVDWRQAEKVTRDELARVGIELRDAKQAVGTLSGGERQSVAIARAVYFGARVLILDEPTSALGVHESAQVLRHIREARNRGLAIIFITHNVTHAMAVADKYVVLAHGRNFGNRTRATATRDDLYTLMAGGREMDELVNEIEELDA